MVCGCSGRDCRGLWDSQICNRGNDCQFCNYHAGNDCFSCSSSAGTAGDGHWKCRRFRICKYRADSWYQSGMYTGCCKTKGVSDQNGTLSGQSSASFYQFSGRKIYNFGQCPFIVGRDSFPYYKRPQCGKIW